LSDRYRYQLQSLCLDADYVIDIHSSSNQSIDYLYCFHDREESAKAFLLDWGILLNEYDGDAFDEAFLKPWLALEKHLADLERRVQFDIESWTLELGSGMQMNPASVEKGVRGIKNYLAQKGLLKVADFPLTETAEHQMLMTPKGQMKKYYAPQGGMVQNRLSPGKTVKAGERLYQLLSFNKEEKVPTLIEIQAEAPGLVFDVSTNYGVNQSEYVLSMVTLPD
jgi:predicted deacylase